MHMFCVKLPWPTVNIAPALYKVKILDDFLPKHRPKITQYATLRRSTVMMSTSSRASCFFVMRWREDIRSF